jgi:hypothetical protein
MQTVDWVGVLHGSAFLTHLPKRELLLFDKVALVDLDKLRNPSLLTPLNQYSSFEVRDQMEYLVDQGLVIPVPEPLTRLSNQKALPHVFNYFIIKKFDVGFRLNKRRATSVIHCSTPRRALDEVWTFLSSRLAASRLAEEQRVSAVSAHAIPDALYELQAKLRAKSTVESKAVLSDVVHIVLLGLPQPDELTPIEDLIAFKKDSDAKQSMLELRVWMREMARAELPPAELEEKFMSLLLKYERHMNLHKMKIRKGILETVITTAAEIAEDVVKIKWSKVVNKLFTIRANKLELMEAEAEAPGGEVSYVVRAKKRFAGDPTG